jgi:hypothetical protein
LLIGLLAVLLRCRWLALVTTTGGGRLVRHAPA